MKFSTLATIARIVTSSVSAAPGFTRSPARQDGFGRFLADGHDHHDDHAKCNMHEIDFVMVEGDAIRSSVEDEIVEMLARVGIKVNTLRLSKEEFNAAEQAGDFHMSFSETWGAPYDPHAYSKGWVAQDEGHFQALAGLEAPNSRDSLFAQIEEVLREETDLGRKQKWASIHKVVHDNAVMLPLWGARVPTLFNSKRLTNFQAGNQQFDYPVHKLDVLQGSSTVTIAPGGQTGIFSSVGRLDPHTYRPNEFFASNWVYEGLVSYGSDGQVLPSLAESWTVTEKGAGNRYTFQLRPNVSFHDGAEWNCDAAKLNFDHVLAPPLRGSGWHGWYGMVEQIDSWECASMSELVIDTKSKYYPFLQELSFIRPLRMLSPAAFAGDADPLTSNSCHVGWGIVTDPSTDVEVTCAGTTAISGTGPWKFASRTPLTLDDGSVVDSEVEFSANANYWDGAPSIETLLIKRYESSDSVAAALLDGSLDVVWGSGVLSPEDLVSLDEDETNGISVFHSDDIQNVIVLLNSGKAPLNDINLRKTIIHAIDKMEIIDHSLGGIYKPVDNVFPTDAPYCDVDLTPRWDYDIEKAKFLNCPEPAEIVTVTVTEESGNNDNTLSLGLGVGLGVTTALFALVAIIYVGRTKKLQKTVDDMEKNKVAVSA